MSFECVQTVADTIQNNFIYYIQSLQKEGSVSNVSKN